MKFKAKKAISITLVSTLLIVSFATYFATRANAALLSSASIELADSRPSNTGTAYTIKWTFPSTTAIECIQVSFGNTSAVTPAPTGMTTTGSGGSINGSITGGLTPGSWSYYAAGNGIFQFEKAVAQGSTASQIQLDITTVTNPSVSTFYAQITTWTTLTTHTCTVAADSSNVMALVTTGGVATSVTVDPTLTFTVAGSSGAVNSNTAANAITDAARIPFGSVPADGATATQAAQLLTTSTNAVHGYSIYIRNTQLLTDANSDTIRAQSGTPGSPIGFDASTSQSSFAYTTNSTTINFGGTNKWAGLTTTNVAVDTQTSAQNANAIKVEYQLQLSNVQPPGTYSNVITYTATPVY